MDTPIIFASISALIVIVALSIGTYQDIKTRRSEIWVWRVTAPFAVIATLLWYGATLMYGDPVLALIAFGTSAILCPFCVYMGFRMGNGGDWRALFYISLLTPWLAPLAMICSAIFGFVQVTIDVIRFNRPDYNSPWMVAITAAFLVSLSAYIFI